MYPAMDKKMGVEGPAITEKDRDSHQRIKKVGGHADMSGRIDDIVMLTSRLSGLVRS